MILFALFLFAVTPDQAASTFNAWVAAAVAMITTLSVAAAVVLPKLAALKAQVETLFNLHTANSDALTQLAIHMPPPAPATPIADTAALEANTAATEANTAATQASDSAPTPVPVPDGPKATDEI